MNKQKTHKSTKYEGYLKFQSLVYLTVILTEFPSDGQTVPGLPAVYVNYGEAYYCEFTRILAPDRLFVFTFSKSHKRHTIKITAVKCKYSYAHKSFPRCA